MAQRISQMPQQALPATQEAFIGSSVNRGVAAMTQPNSGLKNQQDGGTYPNLGMNPQIERNQMQQLQSIQQNGISAAPQQAAASIGQVTNQLTQKSTAEYQAQIGMNNTIANIMEATDNGRATMEMGNPVLVDKRMNDIAVSRAMGNMQAAELGQLQAEAGRYRNS